MGEHEKVLKTADTYEQVLLTELSLAFPLYLSPAHAFLLSSDLGRLLTWQGTRTVSKAWHAMQTVPP